MENKKYFQMYFSSVIKVSYLVTVTSWLPSTYAPFLLTQLIGKKLLFNNLTISCVIPNIRHSLQWETIQVQI